jgi:hypothetical protein
MPRKTEGCTNCGEIREIAAHGLCFKCYRRNDRAGDRAFASVDRHNPAIRQEHKKPFRGFTGLMVDLSNLGVSDADVLRIREIINPYLGPIAKFLTPAPARDEAGGGVNSEQQSEALFTVHTQPGVTPATHHGVERHAEQKTENSDSAANKGRTLMEVRSHQ